MTASEARLQGKLTCLNELADTCRLPAALRTLAVLRMCQGDADFGAGYETDDLAAQEREEDADKLCYRALRALRGERLTPRQRLGLRLWGLAVRLLDGQGAHHP